MSLSSIYILDNKGKILISRDYRGDSKDYIEYFVKLLNESEDQNLHRPVLSSTEASFAYIKKNDLFIVCIIRKNANIALIFAFLRKFLNTMVEYFKELEEESIQDNFVIIHELLDEVVDYGYPQITDSKILQEYITQKGYKLKKKITIPPVVTNCVSWRPEGLKYKRNEVFLDVIESINVLMNANGSLVKAEVNGVVQMKVHLSGMPQLRLGFSDKLILDNSHYGSLEDVKFHHCVQLSRFNNDKTIYFIPPDGDFELMSYRLNPEISPIFLLNSHVEHHAHSRVEYTILLKSQFKKCAIAHNVEVQIPVSNDVDSPSLSCSIGAASYRPENNAILWLIKSMAGGLEYYLKAAFRLSSFVSDEEERKIPIQIKFSIPYFTVSKLHIRYIKIIEKNDTKSLTWVRYTTQNGDYQIRIV
ncbi:unnamed protein product [Brassicogethes aeneus]|uniref:MHD domain-containing protein n=1 Tax=Brassicogethes aeneus TaxID=1431903 RepID=A0A9P0FJS4_BRAAE|nr:unnamed protein product [Brassicogethes aeneus]